MSALPKLALTIRQPWAWAIVDAGKDIENRMWATKYRGLICIHAAKGMTETEWVDTMDFIDDQFPVDRQFAHSRRARAIHSDAAKRGGIIATAEIVDCVRQSESPWFFGPYGFVLANVQPVPFLPCKGALGFFDWRKLNAKEPKP
jgi:hypothetical protein